MGKLSVCCGTAGSGEAGGEFAGRRLSSDRVRTGTGRGSAKQERRRRRGPRRALLIGGAAGGRGWHCRRETGTPGLLVRMQERRSLLGDPQQLDLPARQDEVAVEGAHVLASAHPSSGLQHIRLRGSRRGL